MEVTRSRSQAKAPTFTVSGKSVRSGQDGSVTTVARRPVVARLRNDAGGFRNSVGSTVPVQLKMEKAFSQ